MRRTVLDKSVICTSFACAVAAFACGFVFCMAIISNSSGCYFLIKDFWKVTRGYSWYQSLRHMTSDQILLSVAIIGLILFLISMIISIVQFFSRKSRQVPSTGDSITSQPAQPEKEQVLPQHPIIAPFVEENDVASALQTYRRNSDAQSWEKLNSLEPTILAKYLKKEYPQVAAIVLSKLKPQKSADVLALLPGAFAAEIVAKMLNMHSVDSGLAGTIGRAIADDIEKNTIADTSDQISAILRCLDTATEERIMAVLENTSPSVVASLQEREVHFTDLSKLSVDELRQAVTYVSEPKLVMALRGATENLRNHFYNAMSDEQANVIREALIQLGPIKFHDIEKAQQDIASLCQRMFADTLRGI